MRAVCKAVSVWVLCCALGVSAAEDMQSHEGVFTKKREEISQAYQGRFAALRQTYLQALEGLQKSAQAAGDLKKTLAAKTELERFREARSLPEDADGGGVREIQTQQALYVKGFAALEQAMLRELGVLTAQYEQALGRLSAQLTKAGKLDDAVKVEAARGKAREEVKALAEQLAELQQAGGDNAVAKAAPAAAAAPPWARKKAGGGLYMVLDLSGGPGAEKIPVSHLDDVPQGGWTDEHKTEKLVLRRVPAGTFTMGSPEGETGRKENETLHKVTLTKDFYIGVFEVTQRQYELVTGDNPSETNAGKGSWANPVEQVSWDTLKEGEGFIARVSAKTGLAFDLPTEAQWEYACRAGTAAALNTGKDLTADDVCPNLSEAGRYKGNRGDGTHAKAGSYLPNAWGLYDMHGNVWEWCLDRHGDYGTGAATDPKGAATGSSLVFRGGGWFNAASPCRSACRNGKEPSWRNVNVGFRLSMTLP